MNVSDGVASREFILNHVEFRLRKTESTVEKEMFILMNASAWSSLFLTKGCKVFEKLLRHNAAMASKQIMENFVNRIKNMCLSIKDYHLLSDFFKKRDEEEIIAFASIFESEFRNHWCQIAVVYTRAESKLQSLRVTLSTLQLKLQDVAHVDCGNFFKSEMNELENKLSKDSPVTMAEVNQRDTFDALKEISQAANKLQPLLPLKTFCFLARQLVYKSDLQSGLRGVGALDLAIFLVDRCIPQYKEWIVGISKTATLEHCSRYGLRSVVCKELPLAADHFKFHLQKDVLNVLTWIEKLDRNCERVSSIRDVLKLFEVYEEKGKLEQATCKLLCCREKPESVTVGDLPEIKNTLEELLSDDTNDWWETLQQLATSSNLLQFLRDSIKDDFVELINAVEYRAEQTIDESTVSDLIKVQQFFQAITASLEPHGSARQLLQCMKTSLQRVSEGRPMSIRINTCAYNLHGLNALYDLAADRGALTKTIISNALSMGSYRWFLDHETGQCVTELAYITENESSHTSEKYVANADEMKDLRRRALFMSDSDKSNEKSAQLRTFIDIIRDVEEVTTVITELHNLGHFDFRAGLYEHEIYCSENIKLQLESLLFDLKEKLSQWRNLLAECRTKYKSLNFVFSEQLSLLSSYLISEVNAEVSKKVQNIINFVQPGTTLELLQDAYKRSRKNKQDECTVQGRLHIVGKTVDQLLNTEPTHREFPQVPQAEQCTKIDALVPQGQMFIVQLEALSTQTISVLLSLYASTMHHFPLPSEILFCHDTTSWEEVNLLIERCVMSTNLHCIAFVEKLSSALQYDLVGKLDKLSNQHSCNKYRLAIVCRGGSHHPILDHFSSYVHRVQGLDTATMNHIFHAAFSHVRMVTSSVPGLGKTEKIRSEAAESGHRVITVHISGPMSREILAYNLKSINMEKRQKVREKTKRMTLHLDIAEVDNPDLLDVCLFEFLVLGSFCSGTDIVCLPAQKVYIEVANTVGDKLRDSLYILSCFERQHITWEPDRFAKYVVSQEISSPVQVVCHYLQAESRGFLDSTDIIFSGSSCVEPLSGTVCREILDKTFSATTDVSFTVVQIFLNVFAEQLKKLSCSKYFTCQNLRRMLGVRIGEASAKSGKGEEINVRSKLVTALLDVSREFACRSVITCRAMQSAALDGGAADKTVKVTMADLMEQRLRGMLQWDQSNHLIIVFHADAQTTTPLYRKLHDVPAHIKALFKSQLKELKDYAICDQTELYQILLRLARVSTYQVSCTYTDTSYALTSDNLLKMVLVLLRLEGGIPVIVMGETGCGKTSLIRFLARTCGVQFEHFNIHAGVTAETIVSTVTEWNAVCQKNRKKCIWLFLDEINTSDHMGLLTDIICHHCCRGQALASNLVLLAACNPYRLRDEKHILTAGLGGKLKIDEYSRLVYRVHPLPETMIDYVWDYGTLHSKDEKAYIKQMVSQLPDIASDKGRWLDVITDLLIESQDFARKRVANEICVSLRDVNRCRKLVEFFYGMLTDKERTLRTSNDGSSLSSDTIRKRAVILALAHCYQSRLSTAELRHEYWTRCSAVLGRYGHKDDFKDLEEIVTNEQRDLLNTMEIPHGVAKNTALCENVFVLFVCIQNKIPIFLVGKPGCSKSLSVQLLKSNLRGKDSQNEYLKSLPQLYILSYQCSESSTSEGILKVFDKAEKYRKANENQGVMPVVLLDEVGLAEASKFNPLKVLHSLLEPEDDDFPKIAVVGLSNWSLDAAKMNRAIHLSRPDMDVDELHNTGKLISSASADQRSGGCNENVGDKALRNLAEAYFDYQANQRMPNFHGLRDYYSLIKYISRRHQEQISTDTADTFIQKGLMRNFGGMSLEMEDIITKFMSDMTVYNRYRWKMEDVIIDNVNDKLARHLMIITRTNFGIDILNSILSVCQKRLVVIFGSRFEEDQCEDYFSEILNHIILFMESGYVLVLKDLDSIYGSLYDMLNQYYTEVGQRKTCRIALGPYNNPVCQVHDDFRCIILLEELQIKFSDPPFLNRFEKQILQFDDILHDDCKSLITQLELWIENFSRVPDLPFNSDHAFIGLNCNTLPSLVHQMSKVFGGNNDKMLEECKLCLLWLVPPDAMIRTRLSVIHFPEIKELQDVYFQRPVHSGLCTFLMHIIEVAHGRCRFTSTANVEKKETAEYVYDGTIPPSFVATSALRLVVYTHSNIHIDLSAALHAVGPHHVVKLGAFKSEKQLSQNLNGFFSSPDPLLLLQCKPDEDGEHIPLAVFLIEELQREHSKRQKEKHVCILVHVSRATDVPQAASWQFSYLSGWRMVTIDSIEDQSKHPLATIRHSDATDSAAAQPLLQQSVAELLRSDFRPIRECIRENLMWAFACTSSSYVERTLEEFSELLGKIMSCEHMLSCLGKVVLSYIESCVDAEYNDRDDICDPNNWQSVAARNMCLLDSAGTFVNALKLHISQCVTTPLANIIYRLESLSAWHSYFRKDSTLASQYLWETRLSNPDVFDMQNIRTPTVGSFQINCKPLNLKCAFSQCVIEKLSELEESFRDDLKTTMSRTANLTEEGELKKTSFNDLFQQFNNLFREKMFMTSQSPGFSDMSEADRSKLVMDICSVLSKDDAVDEHRRMCILLAFEEVHHMDVLWWKTQVARNSAEHTESLSKMEITELFYFYVSTVFVFPELPGETMQCGKELVRSSRGICNLLSVDSQLSVDDRIELLVSLAEMLKGTFCKTGGSFLQSFMQKDLCYTRSPADIFAQHKRSDLSRPRYQDNKNDFIADICNLLSRDYQLKESERIDISLWFCKLKSQRQMWMAVSSDPYAEVTGTLLCIWRYNELYRALLHLLTQCRNILPYSIAELLQQTTGMQDGEELQPEEKLVAILCERLIPTDKVLAECFGLYGWHSRVCSVLSFGSLVSSYPLLLHGLRVFNDVATILIQCEAKPEQVNECLVHLASGFHHRDLDHMLDSPEMFGVVAELNVKMFNMNVPVSARQVFFSMYINRCIDVDSNSDILAQFLEKYTAASDDDYFSNTECILQRCVLGNQNAADIVQLSMEYIRTESPGFISMHENLAAIDLSLKSEVQLDNNRKLLVLCIDVFDRFIFSEHTWNDLEEIQSANDDLLSTYVKASEICDNSENVCLRMAVAAAFVKKFLHYLSKILIYDNDTENFSSHSFLYQHVSAVIQRLNHVSQLDFLVKEMRLNRTLSYVKNVFHKVRDVLPSVERFVWPDDDVILSLGYRTLAKSSEGNSKIKQLLLSADRDDKRLCEYIKVTQSQTNMLNYIESVSQIAYLPSALRSLKDSEKRVATWTNQHPVNDTITQNLIQRLSGEVAFGIDLMRLTSDCGILKLHQSAVLVHLISAVATAQQINHLRFFRTCVLQPMDTVVKDFGEVLSSQENWHRPRHDAVSASLFGICRKCRTRALATEQTSDCPICHTEWRLVQHQPHDVHPFCCSSKGAEIARDILALLFHASRLSSLAIGIYIDSAGLSEVNDALQNIWSQLEKTLEMTTYETGLLLHYVIDNLVQLETELGFGNKNDQERSIETLEQYIVDKIWQDSLVSDLKEYMKCISDAPVEFKEAILEISSKNEKPSTTEQIFQTQQKRTFSGIEIQYYMSNMENQYLLMGLFIEMIPALNLIQHLLPILKWVLLCNQFVNYTLSRNECKKTPVEDFVYSKSDKDKKYFKKFHKSWKAVCRHQALLRHFCKSLPQLSVISQKDSVQVMLLENTDSQTYKVLMALATIQNVFIDNLMVISSSRKCPVLGFLQQHREESNPDLSVSADMVCVKSVMLQHVTDSQIIRSDIDELLERLTLFAENHTGYGTGKQLCCNFVKMEMELANELALGKSYLVMDNTFPLTVYANELFIACASVLLELKTIIPQVPMQKTVVDGIEETCRNDKQYVRKMMRLTEIIMSLVRKTGGHKEETIDSYTRKWGKSLLQGCSTAWLPTVGEPLKLSNIVALYECLENIQADIVMNSLNDTLKVKLSSDSAAELREFAQFVEDSDTPLKSIQTAVKRFIVRYLVNFDTSAQQDVLNQMLADRIAEPSLWPETMWCEDSRKTEQNRVRIRDVISRFPEAIRLRHAYSAHKFLLEFAAVSTLLLIFRLGLNVVEIFSTLTRGNDLRLKKFHVDYDLRNFSFSNRVVSMEQSAYRKTSDRSRVPHKRRVPDTSRGSTGQSKLY